MNSILKGTQKVLASLTMTATVLGMAGFAALTPVAALAVVPSDYGLHEGDTISAIGSNDPDIYIVNDWGYKRLFVNPAIFTLYGHLSWAGVKSVSPATRDAFGTSGLFRNCETGDQKVYGLDVISEDVANLRWVNTSGAQAVADDPNFFKKVFCINTAEMNLYGRGADYTSVLQVPVYSRGGVIVPPSGPISVSLASDNPASGTLIETQAAADLAHFTLSGNGAVTSFVLNRTGVSSDTTLSNVYLYQGSKRLTDAATVSTGKITFSDSNGLFTVSGSTTISVKADIADSTTGQTVGVQLASVNGNAVSISGNLFTIAVNASDFGTIAVGVPTPTTANATLDPQNDYPMWQSQLTIGNHDAYLKSLQLRIIGSVGTGDLRNFRLYVDGVQVGSAIAQVNMGTPDNGYIVFDLGSGVTLKTGTRVLKLLGDVVGGSNKTFSVSLRQKPDISVVESQYGAGILPTGTFPAAAPTTGTHTVNTGSLTMTKTTDSTAGDVIEGSTGVSLVKYKFEAHGEALKVENLIAAFTSSEAGMSSLRNGAIYVDGSQVGSIQNLCEDSAALVASCSATNLVASANSGTQYNLGSSLIIQPGTPRMVEIRADIYDNIGTNNATAAETISAYFQVGDSNVQRLVTLTYFNGPTTDSTAGNTLTIKTGSFTASKYTGYANQSVVVPQTQYKIGAFNLTAASSEDINVSNIGIDVTDLTNTGAFQAVDLADMFIKVYNDAGSLVYTSSPKATISGTASNSYSVNLTIPKTKTWRVEAYANVLTTATSGGLVAVMNASGLTANSSTSVTALGATGQTITSTSGALNLANGASPAKAMVTGGTTKAVYVFTLQPQYDDYYLDEATFKLDSTVASSTGAVASFTLKNGTTVLATSPFTTVASAAVTMSGLNFPMPQSGGTKTFTVEVQLANVGVGGNDTGGKVLVQLSHLKYRNSSGTVTTDVYTVTDYQGNENRVVKSYPSFANVSLPSTVLAAGTQTLFKSQVTANGDSVAWRKVVFAITTTAGPTISNFKLYENGVDISALASDALNGDGDGMLDYATVSKAFNVAAASEGQVVFIFNTDRTLPANGSVTLELKADLGGTLSAGHSITTKIANTNGTTYVASNDVESLGGAALGGAWSSDVDPTFLWSDLSSPTHSGTTDDWFGDAMIQGLGTSQALYQ